jgi:hypothetical protein
MKTKEEIYLDLNHYLDLKKSLSIKKYYDFPFFVKAISKNELSIQDIHSILEKNPKFFNLTKDGLTLLHYACLSNNPEVVLYVLKSYVQQGLKTFPTLEQKFKHPKLLKYCYENSNIFVFCAIFNLDLSYAKILQSTSDLSKISFEEHISEALAQNSYDILPVVEKIVGKEYLQNFLLSFFQKNPYIFYNKMINHHYNLLKISSYIDFEHKKNEPYNYSHLFFQALNKLDLTITYVYNKKIITSIYFFLNKKFDFSLTDSDEKNIFDYLDSLKIKIHDFKINTPPQHYIHQFEKQIIEMNNTIIQKSLSKPGKKQNQLKMKI